jgi:hypothetical protein
VAPELDFRAPQCVTKRTLYRYTASFQYVRIERLTRRCSGRG